MNGNEWELMREKGMAQKDVARLLGMTQQAVSLHMTGKKRNKTIERFFRSLADNIPFEVEYKTKYTIEITGDTMKFLLFCKQNNIQIITKRAVK